jgi:hypothetical protein
VKPKWAVRQLRRWDRYGLLEDICEHGIGHPNIYWLDEHDPQGLKMMGVHGCDGCCHGTSEVVGTPGLAEGS